MVHTGNTTRACKIVYKPSLTSTKQKQKLLSEIKIHQLLDHPHICKFETVFEDDENVYMILEYCENRTFVDYLKKRKRLLAEEVAYYMWQLFDGIRYMHRKGYIHRDIKLGNLFLDRQMNLKIGDFGLAAQIDHDGQRKRTICGTPNYIAPEILFDQNGHSFEVDVWSLGVVMYTLLIGKPPFQTKNVKEIYKNIRNNAYEFPEGIEVSTLAKSMVVALLNTKPEERPSIDDVMQHEFLTLENRPKFIPVSALNAVPTLVMERADLPRTPVKVPNRMLQSSSLNKREILLDSRRKITNLNNNSGSPGFDRMQIMNLPPSPKIISGSNTPNRNQSAKELRLSSPTIDNKENIMRSPVHPFKDAVESLDSPQKPSSTPLTNSSSLELLYNNLVAALAVKEDDWVNRIPAMNISSKIFLIRRFQRNYRAKPFHHEMD